MPEQTVEEDGGDAQRSFVWAWRVLGRHAQEKLGMKEMNDASFAWAWRLF